MVQLKKRSENDELMESLSAMVAKLKEVVTNVQAAAENVASGGQELSITTQHMSQGATEQAASAEDTRRLSYARPDCSRFYPDRSI